MTHHRFSSSHVPRGKEPGNHPLPQPAVQPEAESRRESGFAFALNLLWYLTVFALPVLRWLLPCDIVYQAMRMLYFWNTPGSYAGFTFLLHFLGYAALIYFVAGFQPRLQRDRDN